jgi:hypothetical protein
MIRRKNRVLALLVLAPRYSLLLPSPPSWVA